MRRLLIPAIAFAWAACLTAQAAQWSAAMAASDGATQLIAAFMVWGSLAAAALFLWFVGKSVTGTSASGTGEGSARPVLRLAYVGAALMLVPAVVAAVAAAQPLLATLLFLQACALGGSYLVTTLEWRREARPAPVNDNRPLTARLMAARAARMAMLDEITPRASRRPGGY